MTAFGPWNALIFTVSIVLAGFAGFKAGERSKNAHITGDSPKGPVPSEGTSTNVVSGPSNSKVEAESDEEAAADGDLASVHTNGPCKLVSYRCWN